MPVLKPESKLYPRICSLIQSHMTFMSHLSLQKTLRQPPTHIKPSLTHARHVQGTMQTMLGCPQTLTHAQHPTPATQSLHTSLHMQEAMAVTPMPTQAISQRAMKVQILRQEVTTQEHLASLLGATSSQLTP